jgi:glycosyltransferase involved in cell wall biosynthesis
MRAKPRALLNPPPVRTVLAFPGNMADAQNAARALMEADALDAFVTTYAYRRDGLLETALSKVPFPGAQRISRELARRSVDQLPMQLVHTYPVWEMLRTCGHKLGAGATITDTLWDRMSRSFDALVAKRYVPRTKAIQGFEYTALSAFKRAKEEGVARILHLPSLDSLEFEEIRRRERSQWPELASEHDAYFDRKFERRYRRRCEEIELADVMITNSSLTARSHIKAGADPSKFFAVPLGAPPSIREVRHTPSAQRGPLNVLWAGTFQLRKGAHYLLEAWRRLPQAAAVLNVYGAVELPERLLQSPRANIVFHGSVPKPMLFKAYEAADILVFPTLSDGFGMVVTEAMAHGLPVITTEQAGAADLVTPDNGLIIPAADPGKLADALQWCLGNRSRLTEMRHHALETARGRQWSDFRRDLITALSCGLRRAGYIPEYTPLPPSAGEG